MMESIELHLAELTASLQRAGGQDKPIRRRPTRPAHIPSYVPTDIDRAKARAALRRMGLGGQR